MAPSHPARQRRSTGEPELWIAVVDDDRLTRHSLARSLRLSGINVKTFASAEAYLGRSGPGEPRCLVLDVNLKGGMSGIELYECLSSGGEPPPIIFITGHDEISPTDTASLPGSCVCLRKPVDTNVLLSLVLSWYTNTPADPLDP